jgi:transcriptional regulator with XRE-family HTH domain
MQLYDMSIPMMGNRLKDIIEREKISAYRISKDLGLDKGHLSKVLNGKAEYSIERLTMIADYLGYDIELVKRKPSKKGR